jgi:cold shock protein
MYEEVKAPRHTGVVKWFNAQSRGYGFIQDDLGANDIFWHITSVERSGLNDLREGQRVRYDLESDRRTGKTKAINIELII